MPDKLYNVSLDDFAHPEDIIAIKALKKVPGADKLVSWIEDASTQILTRMDTLGSCIRLTRENAPEIYSIVEDVCDILEYDKMPELYTRREYSLDVIPNGVDKPILIIPDLAMNTLDRDALYFTIGRAITRLKSDYLKFFVAAQLILIIGEQLPVNTEALIIPLSNWMRKSELTSDRGGLLACQNYRVAMRFLLSKAGMPYPETEKIRITDYIETTDERDIIAKAGKGLKTLVNASGWSNDRIKELFLWYAQGSYDDLLEKYI